jgi:hypothetical protein
MTIVDLVRKYESDRKTYLSSSYKEAQLRIDFLDPLFELLGWDIKNIGGKPTHEREVLVEETLSENVDSSSEKPDYTFRLFSERKFYLEAKKPSVKIENDENSAKQVRRYGFTARLKISVLSNFEYLAIYDCSEKVEENHNASHYRIKIYHYTEYIESFEEIRNNIGKDSVYSGDFDKTWEHIEDQLKLFSVDDLFLAQINDWRITLGKEIFKHNSTLSEIELNDLVQRYINSIIFLRVCEDRKLEKYKTLWSSNGDYQTLITLFQKADKKYNAGLFQHPLNEEIIRNNSSAFWTAISQLYYPESTYSFAVFGSDVLGNIYEIFLGQKLAVDDNGDLSLVDKPEHVDRDIVTTPTFVIKDVLRKTIIPFCQDKTDLEIFSSKFADIACGSGAFLLEIYQLLTDYLVDYYLQNDPNTLIQTGINTYKLPFDIKKKVLLNCIYGVDKDFNAVEACKFGLLLKLLEDENNKTISKPALPLLDNNIIYGNSLINSSYVSQANRADINPYDFDKQKFDVIVGNPPYMSTESMKKITPLELPLYKQVYQSAFKQFDKYFLFIERSYQLLEPGGYLGFIVPSKFTKVGAGKKLRGLLKEKRAVKEIVSFGANQLFQDKTNYTCLLFLKKSSQENMSYLEVRDLGIWLTRKIQPDDYENINWSDLDDDAWILVPANLRSIYDSINNRSQPLEDLLGTDSIYNGIQTSANKIYIHQAINEDDEYLYFIKEGKTWQVEKILTRPYFQTSSGDDNLNTYRPFTPNSFVLYPYIKTDKGVEFVTIDILERDYPYLFDYLNAYKKDLDNPKRDIKPAPETPNEWYRYGRHQSLEKCDVPAKIVVGVLSQGNKYAIDFYGTLISSGGTAGYCMITPPEDSPYSIYYIQAILNSKYLEWYSSLLGEVFRGGYIARGTKVLKKLPIPVIDFHNSTEKSIHDKIASAQEDLIIIQGKIDQNKANQRLLQPLLREFEQKKEQLDIALHDLFGLGKDDYLIPLIKDEYETDK